MMKYNPTPESGFSLVELAIVLLISGMMLGGAMTMIKPYIEMSQRNTTMMKQENIAKALANYAKIYGRLPCPGAPNPTIEPYGAPRQSGVDGDITNLPCSVGAPAMSEHIGIVPFKVLGLTEDNVKDSWGNLMRYAVTNVIAGYEPSPGEVHDQCRTAAWIDISGPVNRNLNKAKLCCTRAAPSSSNDLRVMDQRTGGNSLYPLTHTTSGAAYGANSTLETPPASPPAAFYQNVFVAYVLVSHGVNGEGAFIGRSNLTKPAMVPGGAAAQESGNRDTDRDFVSQPLRKTWDNNYFDDIVLWRTNQQLASEFGNDSCARP